MKPIIKKVICFDDERYGWLEYEIGDGIEIETKNGNSYWGDVSSIDEFSLTIEDTEGSPYEARKIPYDDIVSVQHCE